MPELEEGFGGDPAQSKRSQSRAGSPPIDGDTVGPDDEDGGVLHQKLKEAFGACAK